MTDPTWPRHHDTAGPDLERAVGLGAGELAAAVRP